MRKQILFFLGLVLMVMVYFLSRYIDLAPKEQIIYVSQILERKVIDGIKYLLEWDYEKIQNVTLAAVCVWMVLNIIPNKRVIENFINGNMMWLSWPIKLAYILTIILILAYFLIEDRELYEEDRVFEQGTAIFFFIAGILMNIKAIKPGDLGRWILVLGGISFIFLGMEEISWGQRIFNIETPEILKNMNDQEELNFHNIFNSSYPTVLN